MIHLQSSLTGDACEAVRGLLCDGSLYKVALSELEIQFGNPTVVVQSALSSVLQHPIVRHDITDLTSLSRALHTAVSVLQNMGYQADLAATSSMQQVIAKLPSALAWQWGQVEVEMMLHIPTPEDIDSWLKKVVLAGRLVQPTLCSGRSVQPTGRCDQTDAVVASAEQAPGRHKGRQQASTAHNVSDYVWSSLQC